MNRADTIASEPATDPNTGEHRDNWSRQTSCPGGRTRHTAGRTAAAAAAVEPAAAAVVAVVADVADPGAVEVPFETVPVLGLSDWHHYPVPMTCLHWRQIDGSCPVCYQ